jgi:hypothetical protein
MASDSATVAIPRPTPNPVGMPVFPPPPITTSDDTLAQRATRPAWSSRLRIRSGCHPAPR